MAELEEIVSSDADPFAGQILSDKSYVIEAGISVQNLIDDPKEKMPDWPTEKEVLLLMGYMPENRKQEMEYLINRLANSISDPPKTFAGWAELHRNSRPGSVHETIAMIMLVRLADDFREWLVVYSKLSDRYITLKRMAAKNMMRYAVMLDRPIELGVAKRKMKEVWLA